MKVACIVVTRDRRDLLRQCLQAIAAQTRPADEVFVVDNVSSDGTPDMVREEFPGVEVLEQAENLACAGGYGNGMLAARAAGADWIWLLDDDTNPTTTALEELLAATTPPDGLPAPSLLAGRVDWTDGNPHPMNQVIVRRRDTDGLVAAAGAGLLPLRSCTYVSLLVEGGVLDRHGPPLVPFFFQGDDMEWTARVLRSEHGYYVPGSVVVHETASAHDYTVDGFKFFHHLRNTIWQIRGSAWSGAEKAALGWVVVHTSARFLRRHGLTRESVATIARGLFHGVTRPTGA
jgi:GT2 family glycosyltransferase